MGFWATNKSGTVGVTASDQAYIDSLLGRPAGYNPILGTVDPVYNKNPTPMNDGGEGLLSNADYSGAVTPPPPIQMKTIPQTEGSWKSTTPAPAPVASKSSFDIAAYLAAVQAANESPPTVPGGSASSASITPVDPNVVIPQYNPTGLLSDFGGNAQPSALRGFGNLNYGLLSPTQVTQFQADAVPTVGQYGQTIPGNVEQHPYLFDPYANLRAMEGDLKNNPNFSWLGSLNTARTNIDKTPAYVGDDIGQKIQEKEAKAPIVEKTIGSLAPSVYEEIGAPSYSTPGPSLYEKISAPGVTSPEDIELKKYIEDNIHPDYYNSIGVDESGNVLTNERGALLGLSEEEVRRWKLRQGEG